ncbi:MAG: methyltransferase domain-containing protein [Anaerolineaceae bacterium]|nr:methyltransferase domain-containing protein [Anaerolineaceae bacterium]
MNNYKLERLACPSCHGLFSKIDDRLICTSCNRTFSIQSGVPILHRDLSSIETLSYDIPDYSPAYRLLRSIPIFPFLRYMYHFARNLDKRISPSTPLDREYNLERAFPDLRELSTTIQPRVILDIGGGDGRYRPLMARTSDEYWNLEIDPTIQRLNIGDFGTIGDIHFAPFRDEQFDVVIMLEVLEHLYDPFRAVSECYRLLKPGGTAFITTPQYCMIHAFPSDYYRYTAYGLRHIFEQAGFKMVSCQPMGGRWLLLYFLLSRSIMPVIRQPPLNLLINLPLLMFFRGLDLLFDRSSWEQQRNPDTYGWSLLAQKPQNMVDL